MAHARKQIRDAISTVLTGLTTTGSNVFLSRLHVVDQGPFPCLLLYALKDDALRVSLGSNREQERKLELQVHAVVSATSTLDDGLDQICLEVEKALAVDPTLGGLTADLVLNNTLAGLNITATNPVGEAVMDFTATYFVRETDPGVLV